jgi:hypothetical protein
MKHKSWFALAAFTVCALPVGACSSDFTSCEETRTCASGGAAGSAGAVGGEAGAVGGGVAKGGTPGSGGQGGAADSSGAAGEAAASAGMGGESGEPGASGTGGAAGAAGDSGSCALGSTRTCADGGLVGKCAAGVEKCTADGVWGACSITPAAADTCVRGNNDDCSGAPNEGCLCINGVTKKPCGACNDGTQVCSDGVTNSYGACTGAVQQPTTYFRDADGDGFGSAATTTVCGPPPAGYTDQSGDCCDDGGNLALAKTIFPGQTLFFDKAANICGITWNYNCSANGSVETPMIAGGCVSDTPPCTNAIRSLTESACGTQVGICGCATISNGTCMGACSGGTVVTCH